MKTTKEKIEVMQAFDQGAQIECYSRMSGDWMPASKPSWDWANADYRIKPREPRVIWVNEYGPLNDYCYTSVQAALKGATPAVNRVAVKYQEVIE